MSLVSSKSDEGRGHTDHYKTTTYFPLFGPQPPFLDKILFTYMGSCRRRVELRLLRGNPFSSFLIVEQIGRFLEAHVFCSIDLYMVSHENYLTLGHP